MSNRSTPRAHAQVDVLVFTKRSGRGGVERVALRLMEGWRSHGIAVAHATQPPGRSQPEWLELLQLIPITRRMIREQRPAVLFCPGNAYAIVAVLLKLLLGRDCPPIVCKISNDLQRSDMLWPLRLAYLGWLRLQGLLISDFAGLSRPMAAEIMTRLGVPAHRVHVVPNPVLSLLDIYEDAARPARSKKDGRRFIAVGRLEPQKDLSMMLRAFARGSADADTLTIVGEGPRRAALERLALSLGIAARVRFAGWCGAVRQEMARHDILLLSSVYEGQPGVVVEALSVGLGVVATRCCAGMSDLLDDGAVGTLVPTGDEAAFAAAVGAAQPGAQNRERARLRAERCTIEAALPAYAALFATVIGRADPGRASTSSRPALAISA